MEEKYFAAANSGEGFVSYFGEVFGEQNFEHVYIIKGGPGTGKSYLLKEDVKEVKAPAKVQIATKQETEKTYSMEEVRAILSAKSKAGYREQVKALITKRGVDNLTKLDPSEYASLVKEVEELANG